VSEKQKSAPKSESQKADFIIAERSDMSSIADDVLGHVDTEELEKRLEALPKGKKGKRQLDDLEATPMGSALRLLQMMGNDLLLVHLPSKKPLEDGGYAVLFSKRVPGYWLPDDVRFASELMESEKNWMDGLLIRFQGPDRLSAADWNLAFRYLRTIATPEGKKKVRQELANSYLHGMTEGYHLHTEIRELSEIDADMTCLGFPNGVLDLTTGELLQEKAARSKFVTKILSDPYDPKAWHPLADSLFEHPCLDDEERAYVLDVLGYALLGKPDLANAFYVFFDESGGGKSGKSTLFEAVQHSLGPHITGTLNMDALKKAKGEVGRATPERKVLATKRLAFSEEVESVKVINAMLKSATGSAMVEFRELYAANQTLPLRATMFFNQNGIPTFNLMDHAVASRYRPVHFPTIPPEERIIQLKDIGIGTTDQDKIFRQAIVRKLVESALRRVKEGPPAIPERTKAMIESHRRRQLGVGGQFIEENVVLTSENHFLTSKDLWERFAEYADEDPDQEKIQGLDKAGLSKLFGRLHNTSTQRAKVGGRMQTGWHGWALIQPDSLVDAALAQGAKPISGGTALQMVNYFCGHCNTVPDLSKEPLPKECPNCGLAYPAPVDMSAAADELDRIYRESEAKGNLHTWCGPDWERCPVCKAAVDLLAKGRHSPAPPKGQEKLPLAD